MRIVGTYCSRVAFYDTITTSVVKCIAEVANMSTISYSFRIEEETKSQLDKICDAIGMSTATAFNIFAKRMVAERALPFKPAVLQDEHSTPITLALSEIQEKTKNYDVSEDEILDMIMQGRSKA
jgi:addiction module RelB/DinJ family antitoxin